MTRYIFTIGGVLSGLGKGISTASLGLLLKQKGYTVTAVKVDPYISIDAGTMRPVEHGETFVTADGAEIDQDVGNYERFLDVNLTRHNNITSGKIYQAVIDNERSFKYQGRDAEMFPDVIDEIKKQIYDRAKGYDFCLVEIGGTSGDLENMPFLHAAREIGREHPSAYLMVTYLPFLRNVGELKTKPTQHAVAAVRSVGIFPDIIITRNEVPLDKPRRETISKRCFVAEEDIIDNPDTDCIYNIPQLFEKEKLADRLLKKFKMRSPKTNLSSWNRYVTNLVKPKATLKIGMVGKYFKNGGHNHKDVYISVDEALLHAGGKLGYKPEIVPIDSNLSPLDVVRQIEEADLDGLVAPQGWGTRGVEGVIAGIRYARENRLPYLGLCFGMQLATAEFARNVAMLEKANSIEADPHTPHPVVHIMPDQKKYLEQNQYGGTIRLGNWPCVLKTGSLIEKIYRDHAKLYSQPLKEISGQLQVEERHRHRYEFNSDYKMRLEQAGLIISGTSPDGKLAEAVELPQSVHPFFLGTQFHPEYQSRPMRPHPIFVSFLEACFSKQ